MAADMVVVMRRVDLGRYSTLQAKGKVTDMCMHDKKSSSHMVFYHWRMCMNSYLCDHNKYFKLFP